MTAKHASKNNNKDLAGDPHSTEAINIQVRAPPEDLREINGIHTSPLYF